ncbi:probable RNA methyltransferase Y17G7B.18 isoform X2 [Anoplophora glabripennis]|uniref:probable RNA methyltransferase Y17G7B.18 isoform X2 n=1 Tax=Anoplophora glabripennis TaxID=217634 RepID=UPI0008751DC5|nr:probable RNA methyltransferase Y17G7B.18 isoform X2 [Anoplophora glabripennis]
MSSVEVLEPPVKTNNHNHRNQMKATNNNNANKRKNKHDRSSRKRSKSFSGCGLMINQKPVLPTKFLLGGNIKDPLNLNSLQDEEINRAMNAVTPKSSPVPTPPRKKGQLEVIIPRNIHDPLNLIDCADDAEYEQQLCSPVKKGRKKKPKKRRTMSGTMETTSAMDADTSGNSVAKTPETSTDSAKIPEVPDCTAATTAAAKPRDLSIELCPKKEKNKRKSDDYGHAAKKFKNSMDKIVSPVVPQPGAWLKRSTSVNKRTKPRPKAPAEEQPLPQFKEKDKQFQYGNYNRYYGYRNPNNEIDHRLRVFSHHPYLFENKDILDIGCNIGHITLSVARDFRARSITGIDIDQKLISIARKNIKHYVKTVESPRPDEAQVARLSEAKSSFHDKPKGRGFPNNVTFKQCNYILEDDNLIALEQPQYDIILCLSITKWIHLNWGDNGIKQAFRRMYAQLRPGGKLVVEPQNWASYKSKRKLTETIYKNYNAIEFFPEKFREYLLSAAVGFAKSEILGYPPHLSRGFRRPIQVFTKSTMFPSERIEATPNSITPNVGVYNDSLYQKICKTEKYESRTQPEICVEHVYTDIIENRYCGREEDITEVNECIEEDLRNTEEMECSNTSQAGAGRVNGEEDKVKGLEKSGKAGEVNGLEPDDKGDVSGENT